MQRAHWQAHEGAISSVDLIPMHSSSSGSGGGGNEDRCNSGSSGSQVLILTGSRDCNVAVWTLDGGLVGVLGEHSWDLDDSGTWQDAAGLKARRVATQEQQQQQPLGQQQQHDGDDDDSCEVGM